MTIRLSNISFAGMARTLVAVGMASEADMFLATAAAAPRRTFDSSTAGAGADAFASFAAVSFAGAAFVEASVFGGSTFGAAPLGAVFGAAPLAVLV